METDNQRNKSIYRDVNSSDHQSEKSYKTLAQEFNYDKTTFWDQIPHAHVIFKNKITIATATQDLIAGLFMKEDCLQILSLALDLSFYAKTSATETDFLYQNVANFVTRSPVENGTTRIIINLAHRGWYDKWIITRPMTQLEHEFRNFLTKPENYSALSFLGPWLATVLLRVEKRRPQDVTNKIVRLLNHDYVKDEISDFHWNDDFPEDLKILLMRFTYLNIRGWKLRINALHRAMIEVSYRNPNAEVLQALLRFTRLQSLEFGGMILVTIIRDLRRGRRFLETNDLVKVTQTPETMNSWINYFNFTTFFKSMTEEEKFYAKFAREFDLDVFENLSYAANMKLCNYLAVLIDIGRRDILYSETNPSPTYQNLILNRVYIEPLTNEDFTFCANAAVDLLIKENTPRDLRSGTIIAQSYLQRAQHYQELADEAFLIARFHQRRAEKFRNAAEEFMRKFQPNVNES